MNEVSDNRSEHEHNKDGDSMREGEGGEVESVDDCILMLAAAEVERE